MSDPTDGEFWAAANDGLDDEYDEPSGVWEQCWNCHGEGGFHDCGEDCCPCLHPELDLNEPCEECDGKGGYYV